MAGNTDTFPKLLKRNYEMWGDKRVAMRRKDFGVWHTYTWKDSYETVKYLSLGLISLGLEPEDKVSIIGDNDPEWYWAEYAIQAAHAAVVGIFVDSSPSEIKYIAEHSDSTFVFAKDQEQVDKMLELKAELPKVKKVIYWEPKGIWSYDDPILLSFNQVIKLGREYEETHQGLFEEMVETTKEDDIMVVCYTSGTTGLPKGVRNSYRWATVAYNYMVSGGPLADTDEYLTYIAPAWGTEQFLGIGGHLITGFAVNFPEQPETVQENIKEISPQLLLYNARLWESQLTMIQVRMNDATLIKRFPYNLFLPVGYKVADLGFEKKEVSLFWKALYAVAHVAVFRPLKDKLGLLRIKSAYTVGSLLSPQAFKYFRALGINLKQVFGLTESGFIACHRDGDIKVDSVGSAALTDEVKVKISDEGEILIGGIGLFTDYYKDPEATAAKMKDGWFYTGDAGRIDEDEHLIFYDRMQDMKELASGYKFAPQYIEGSLKFSPYIKDAMTIGGKDRNYPAAIINMDFDSVGKWAEDHRIVYTTFVDLSQKPQVYDLIKKEIERVNKALPEQAKVRRYVLMHKEFDPDEAELTRTRKLRRSFMETRYGAMIEALYSDKDEVIIEADIKYRDGRVGKITTNIKVATVD